jgi:hypothetical protein
VEKAELQQRKDAEELFKHEQVAFEKYIELYERLQKNLTLYVERSNFELAGLAMLIEQKRQNLLTLDQMRGGHAVMPGPPVSKVGQTFTPPPEITRISEPVGAPNGKGAP